MRKNTETILDEEGFEILVGYHYHPEDDGIETELDSVELVFMGTGIEILHQLSEKQKDGIIDKLSYE